MRHHFLLLLCLLLILGLLPGCSPDRGEAVQTPSPDEARQALLDMIEQHQGDIFMGHFLPVTDLKTAKIEHDASDQVRIGRWTCNLKEATFDVVVQFPNAPHHAYNEWHGVFQRSPEGKWQARVSEGSSG
jgi:hypothetical protein